MLTRVLALFMAILLGVLLLATGVFAGIWMQADFETRSFSAAAAQSLNIAVVNQDMGVDYHGTEINFASEIIDTFGDGYILASRASAGAGITNGTYAAIINFPSDFSNQLAQINAVRPEKAVFRYQLSTTLSQKDAIETLLKIILLERQINETVTFMYTASAFGELHDAQMTIRELLQNQEEGADSIRNFVTAELVSDLDISDKERNIPDIDYLDFSGHMNENDALLHELSERYQEYMSLASDEYKQVLSDAESVFSDTQSVSDVIDAFDILQGSGGGDFFAQMLSEQESKNNDRISRLKRLFESQSRAMQNSHDAAAILNAYDTPRISEEDCITLSEEEIRGILVELLESYMPATSGTTKPPWATPGTTKPPWATPGTTGPPWATPGTTKPPWWATPGTTRPPWWATPGTTRPPVDPHDPLINDAAASLLTICMALIEMQGGLSENYFRDFILDLMLGLIDEISEAFSALSAEIDVSGTDVMDGLSSAVGDLRDFVTTLQDAGKTGITEAYSARNQTLMDLYQRLAEYDPTGYISENSSELFGFNNRFRDNSRGFEELVSDALNTRSDLIFSTYESYDEYVFSLRTDMQAATDESRGLLDSALNRLLTSYLDMQNQNTGLIGGFAEKLPNTRIGSQQNNDFFSFFVQPVTTSEIGYGTQGAFRVPVQKGVTGIMDWLNMAVILLAVIFVIAASAFLLAKMVLKRVDKHKAHGDT